MIGAVGAGLFAIADNTGTLIVARALIGLGTSGALMAGLKALTLWVPKERRSLANGAFIMFGGLGAMASTVPVNLLLPAIGWRGTFLLLSAATVLSAALVATIVPEATPLARPEPWRENLRGLIDIYRDKAFWRVAPLSACAIGTAFAVHGLWAARWLADVNLLAQGQVVFVLLVMGAGLTVGAGVLGVFADFLRRRGVRAMTLFGCACSVFVGLQLTVLSRAVTPVWLPWGVVGAFGGMTVLSYSIIGELFPPEKIGRANGALNVLHLGMAFVVQYGMGVVASRWGADAGGHLPVVAYWAAFSFPLALQAAAFAWFLMPSRAESRVGVTTPSQPASTDELPAAE